MARYDRGYLLAIKEGKFEYDVLLNDAEELKSDLPYLFKKSNLPDEPNLIAINKLLVEILEEYYER